MRNKLGFIYLDFGSIDGINYNTSVDITNLIPLETFNIIKHLCDELGVPNENDVPPLNITKLIYIHLYDRANFIEYRGIPTIKTQDDSDKIFHLTLISTAHDFVELTCKKNQVVIYITSN